MDVTVTFYGGLKERTDCRQTRVTLDRTDATVDDLARCLVEEFPALDGRLQSVAFAIGDDIVDRATAIDDGHEVSLLPPVSGG